MFYLKVKVFFNDILLYIIWIDDYVYIFKVCPHFTMTNGASTTFCVCAAPVINLCISLLPHVGMLCFDV